MRSSIGRLIVGLSVSVGAGFVGAGCGDNVQYLQAPAPGTTVKPSPDKGDASVDDTVTPPPPDGTTVEPEMDAGPPPEVASGPLTEDLAIDEVAFFQAVKIDVVKAGGHVGKAVRNARVIAGREALARVYVKPGTSYKAHDVRGELQLVAPDGTKFPVIKDTKKLTTASTDAVAASTFNFTVPGDSLPKGVTWTVALREIGGTAPASETDSTSQYPSTGKPELLDVVSTGDGLKVVVVPVQYGADGSNRLPDVSPAQLETYRLAMYTMYPAAKVDVTARAPFAYTKAISANGNGFGGILQAIVNLREQDNAPDDVYYFGAFTPKATFQSFCTGGCVVGLSGVGDDPSDATVRASVGVGFSGEEAALTMAHELGHAHGRLHAPCGGAGGPDPQFPYTGGGVGVWGYNIVTKAFIQPTKGKDLMGYCQPEWISDYTYEALTDRLIDVNNAKRFVGAITPERYRFVSVEGNGSVTWGDAMTVRTRPSGEQHTVTYLAADGSVLQTATGHYYRYDHIPGGYMLVPEGPASFAKMTIAGLESHALTHLSRTY